MPDRTVIGCASTFTVFTSAAVQAWQRSTSLELYNRTAQHVGTCDSFPEAGSYGVCVHTTPRKTSTIGSPKVVTRSYLCEVFVADVDKPATTYSSIVVVCSTRDQNTNELPRGVEYA